MIYDLTMPIEQDHFRWPVERDSRLSARDIFEITSVGLSCHAFTHLDAPSHMLRGGETTDDLDLTMVMGRAAIIDFEGIAPKEGITDLSLAQAASHLDAGEIALFRTCWDQQRDWRTPEYWRDAPYMTAGACRWLLKKGPTAVAFDFPQDFAIRQVLDGVMPPMEEHVSHDILLRNGVTLIEYLVGTHQLATSHVQFAALPIKLPASDGAPARVVAWPISI